MRLVLTLGGSRRADDDIIALFESGEDVIFESGETLLFEESGSDTVGVGTALEFVSPTTDGEFPWLTFVGTLIQEARAGHLEGIGTVQTASLQVELDNEDKQASSLLGRPLRALADVYDDDDELFFSGLVQSLRYGRTMKLGLEA